MTRAQRRAMLRELAGYALLLGLPALFAWAATS
jgi:hypothetical protein